MLNFLKEHPNPKLTLGIQLNLHKRSNETISNIDHQIVTLDKELV